MCWTPNRFPVGGRVHFLVARWPVRYFCWAAMERWSCWRFRIYGETYHTIFFGKGQFHLPASIGFTRVPGFRPITRSDLFPNWATAVWIFSLVASRQGKVQRPHGRHIGAWNGCVHGTSPWIHYIYIYIIYIFTLYIYTLYIYIIYIYTLYIHYIYTLYIYTLYIHIIYTLNMYICTLYTYIHIIYTHIIYIHIICEYIYIHIIYIYTLYM